MKKATIIAALLIALMLLVSCGGGAGGNPAGTPEGNGGGGNPLAGKTFTDDNFITQETETWHFDNDGNARWTGLVSAGNTQTYYFHYSVNTSKKFLSLKKLHLGDEMPRTRLYAYELSANRLVLTDAIPSDKTFAQIASDYWFPKFESGDEVQEGYELSIWHASMDEYEEGEMRFEYRNPTYGNAPFGCSYDVTSITDTVITGTKCIPQPNVANYEGYPETISISYTAAGSGEDMEVTASVTTGTDSNSYILTWNPDFNFWDQE